jgi:hypothetical protein
MTSVRTLTCAATCLLLTASTSSATVIDHADVNGFRTFEDPETGLVWLDLDNFFDESLASMISQAQAAGFSFATRAEVEALLSDLPLTSGQFTTYASIMGKAPNRDLIWGAYDDGGDPHGWAFAFESDTSWTFGDDFALLSVTQNAGGDHADMNVWAILPEPTTAALCATALLGFAASRRRH